MGEGGGFREEEMHLPIRGRVLIGNIIFSYNANQCVYALGYIRQIFSGVNLYYGNGRFVQYQ